MSENFSNKLIKYSEKCLKNQEKIILNEIRNRFSVDINDISYYRINIFIKSGLEEELYSYSMALIQTGNSRYLLDLCFYFPEDDEDLVKIVEEKFDAKVIGCIISAKENEVLNKIVSNWEILRFLRENFIEGRVVEIEF